MGRTVCQIGNTDEPFENAGTVASGFIQAPETFPCIGGGPALMVVAVAWAADGRLHVSGLRRLAVDRAASGALATTATVNAASLITRWCWWCEPIAR